jgi:hypothetical protein
MARPPIDLEQVAEIYIDESSQTKHKYLVLGALVVCAAQTPALSDALLASRLPELPKGEIGWVKVSKSKLGAYQRFVDVFFDNPLKPEPIQFHTLVVDTEKLKDKIFNDGSREIGFNKEIFQLCSKCARIYTNPIFHVYPDKRQTGTPTEELRLILNRALSKKGDKRDWPFRRVHFRDGLDSQALQLVDVLLGALAYRLNGHCDAPGASPAKCALSAHVLDKAFVKNPFRDTAPRGTFTIWHRQLK